jgi:hypothetical protein
MKVVNSYIYINPMSQVSVVKVCDIRRRLFPPLETISPSHLLELHHEFGILLGL